MSRINDWLVKYPCGPGAHSYEDTGIQMMPTAEAVQSGRPLNTDSMEAMTQCGRCEKSGWERTLTCEICDWYPATAAPDRVLVLADGTRLRGIPLCDTCHVGVLDGEAGMSIDWER